MRGKLVLQVCSYASSDVHKEGGFRSTRLPKWLSNGKTEHGSDGLDLRGAKLHALTWLEGDNTQA